MIFTSNKTTALVSATALFLGLGLASTASAQTCMNCDIADTAPSTTTYTPPTNQPDLPEYKWGSNVGVNVKWGSAVLGAGAGFTSPGGMTNIMSKSGIKEDVDATTSLKIGPKCDLNCENQSIGLNGTWKGLSDVNVLSKVDGNGTMDNPIIAVSQANTAGQIGVDLGAYFRGGKNVTPPNTGN